MVAFGVMFSLLRTDRVAQRARHLLRQRNYINGGVTSFTIFIRDDIVHDAICFGMSHNTSRECSVESEERVPILQPDEKLSKRLNILTDHFQSTYNVKPSFFVRVPGRVNLIGEHIDYCGYAVCPMAIEQDILVAVALSKGNDIRLTNIDPRYNYFQCNFKDVSVCIKDAGSGPDWYKYFLCGVKGALEVIPEECAPSGILAAVWGNIPPNSGLSSSSALVSAAVLVTVHISQYQLPKRELATISASAERYIGTQGGGMDQAIAFLGKAGSAMLIEFNPLRGTDVTLPKTAVFVIAHSQACHNKASTTDYNLRVAECRLAAQMIAKKRNKPWERVQRLIDVQESLGMSEDEMVSVVTTDLHEEPYTLNEISKSLDTTNERLREISSVQSFGDAQPFKLKQRALHVYQEAARVVKFQRISEESAITEDEKLRQLGNLMSNSHASLRKLYECSHPNVDSLVDKAMTCDAFGARLTGAGWGGCIVAITTKNKVSQFVDKLKKEIDRCEIKDEFKLGDLVFPTEPNQGAAIYTT
ncbi:N-acetylgalactosamine kinase isoform X1 [Bombus fervidus]|uniref:N-acetylgalactosamine kinase isoform X1 n=2 Tax=Bombus fervidus TaxID=203811 RepID=UPI003AB42F87